MRVLKVAQGEDGAAWAKALVAGAPEPKELLKVDSGCTVWRRRVLGREVVVKGWPLESPVGLWKLRLGLSRGRRHWRGAETLAATGIPTARPLTLIQTGPLEMLAMEWLPGPTLLEVMARGGSGVRQEHGLAAAIGAQVARFGKWFNRDHKPSNLMVTTDGEKLSLAVIDTVAIRRAKPGSHARMLASLVLEPTGCGCPPRLALRMRTLTAYLLARGITGKQARSALWRRVEAIVRAHGDPTPRINPLVDGKKGVEAEA